MRVLRKILIFFLLLNLFSVYFSTYKAKADGIGGFGGLIRGEAGFLAKEDGSWIKEKETEKKYYLVARSNDIAWQRVVTGGLPSVTYIYQSVEGDYIKVGNHSTYGWHLVARWDGTNWDWIEYYKSGKEVEAKEKIKGIFSILGDDSFEHYSIMGRLKIDESAKEVDFEKQSLTLELRIPNGGPWLAQILKKEGTLHSPTQGKIVGNFEFSLHKSNCQLSVLSPKKFEELNIPSEIQPITSIEVYGHQKVTTGGFLELKPKILTLPYRESKNGFWYVERYRNRYRYCGIARCETCSGPRDKCGPQPAFILSFRESALQHHPGAEEEKTFTQSIGGIKECNCPNLTKPLEWGVCNMLCVGGKVLSALLDFSMKGLEDVLSIEKIDPVAKDFWREIRKYINLAFVLVFLFIAISATLRISWEGIDWRRMLVSLFIAIVLVNLSMLICEEIIKVSDLLQKNFIGNIPEFSSHLSDNTRGNLLNITNGNWRNLIASGFKLAFGAIFILISLYLYIILWVRVAVINILYIFSAAPYICMILPWTKKYFGMWWRMFLNWVFMGPAVAFCLWMAHLFITGIGEQRKPLLHAQPAPQIGGVSGSIIMELIIAAVMMYIAATYPLKMGGMVMATVSKYGPGKWIKSYAGRAAKTTAAGIGLKIKRRLAPKGGFFERMEAATKIGEKERQKEIEKAALETRITKGVVGRIAAMSAARGDEINALKGSTTDYLKKDIEKKLEKLGMSKDEAVEFWRDPEEFAKTHTKYPAARLGRLHGALIVAERKAMSSDDDAPEMRDYLRKYGFIKSEAGFTRPITADSIPGENPQVIKIEKMKGDEFEELARAKKELEERIKTPELKEAAEKEIEKLSEDIREEVREAMEKGVSDAELADKWNIKKEAFPNIVEYSSHIRGLKNIEAIERKAEVYNIDSQHKLLTARERDSAFIARMGGKEKYFIQESTSAERFLNELETTPKDERNKVVERAKKHYGPEVSAIRDLTPEKLKYWLKARKDVADLKLEVEKEKVPPDKLKIIIEEEIKKRPELAGAPYKVQEKIAIDKFKEELEKEKLEELKTNILKPKEG